MPGFTEKEIALIRARGLDPSKYSPVEDLRPKTQPVTPNLNPGFLEVVGKNAQRQAIPTAGALAGARAGAMIPFPHPAAKVASAFIGGVLGAMGMDFAQKPLTSDKRTKELQQINKERPNAAFLGQVLPSVAAFNPVKGLQSLPALGRALGKANPATTRTAEETALLLNALIGTSAEVGVEGFQQIKEGEFKPGRLALAAGTGLTLNEPNRIGQRLLGLQPTPKAKSIKSLDVIKDIRSNVEPAKFGDITNDPQVNEALSIFKQDLEDSVPTFKDPIGQRPLAKKGALGENLNPENPIRPKVIEFPSISSSAKKLDLIQAEGLLTKTEVQALKQNLAGVPSVKKQLKLSQLLKDKGLNVLTTSPPKKSQLKSGPKGQAKVEAGLKIKSVSGAEVPEQGFRYQLQDQTPAEIDPEVKKLFDAKEGIGSVPKNQDVDYFGFVSPMKPSQFRALVPKGVSGKESKDFILKSLAEGKKLGQPFLQVKWDNINKVWRVQDHEGRSRVNALSDVIGGKTIPVHIFPDGYRARDLTPEMLQAPFIAQETGNIRFQLQDNPQFKTPEFKKFFEGSKVVEDDGVTPKVVYHGTHNKFNIFDRNFASKHFNRKQDGFDSVGLWFTTSKESALEGYGPNITESFLNIKKPLIFSGDPLNPQQAVKQFIKLVRDAGGANAFRKELKGEGYDGVLIQNDKIDQLTGDVLIALEPEQIKSATGNTGAFDPTNPDIRFQFNDPVTGKPKSITEAELLTKPEQIDELTTFDVLSPGAKTLADRRGVQFTVTDLDIIDPVTGQKAFGVADINKGEVRVTTSRLPHTDFHEIGHQTIDDLKSSKRKVDRDFIEEGEKIFGGEEKLADAAGKEGYKFANLRDRSLYPSALKWLQDFGSWIKYKLGYANAEDIQRMFVRRMFEDAPITPAERKLQQLKTVPDSPESNIKAQSQTLTENLVKAEDFKQKFLLKIGRVSLASDLDTIGNLNPTGRLLSKAIDNFYRTFSRYLGRIEAPIVKRIHVLNKESQAKVHDYWKTIAENPEVVPEIKLNNVEQEVLSDIIKWSEGIFERANKVLGKQRIKLGPNNFREAIQQKNFHPDVITQEVTQLLLDRTNNKAEFNRLRKEFVKHVNQVIVKQGIEGKHDPLKIFNEMVNGLSIGTKGKVKPTFRALRAKTAWGVPRNWTEKSLKSTLERYSRRVSRDFAYVDSIESSPEVLHSLGLSDGLGNKPVVGEDVDVLIGNKTVDSVWKDVNQDFGRDDLFIRAVDRLVKSSMMQLLTGSRDIVSSGYHSFVNIPLKDIPKVRLGFKQIKEGIQAGIKNGVIRKSWLDLENSASPYNILTERMNSLAELASKVSGRDWTEMVSRGISQTLGEQAARANLGNLGSDNKRISRQALRFFEEFGKGGALEKVEAHLNDPSKALTDSQLNELMNEVGSQFVEGTQGTYDPRDTPALTREGILSPFLSLTRWSVGRANKSVDQILIPLIEDKNPEPLLKALSFGLLSGFVIEQMSEFIKQKKGFHPDFIEAWNSGNKTEIVSSLLGLLQFAGFAGNVSDMMKTTYDIAKGPLLGSSNIQMPRGFTFPFVDALQETVTTTVDAMSAVGQGAPLLDTLFRWSLDNSVNLVQNARLAAGWSQKFFDEDEAFRKSDLRDLSVQGRLTNIPQLDPNKIKSNPFVDRDIKKARRSRDPEEIVKLTKIAAQRIVNEFKDRPEVMKSKLNSLRRSDRGPLAKTPLRLQGQMGFILKNRGQEDLEDLIMRDLKVQAANNFRKSLLPSF